jgi:hypothetical protein
MSLAPLITQLHETYVARTGLETLLNPTRQRMWFDWLQWSGRTWTPDDLTRTINYLKAEIRTGKRNEGSLKFTNLIGQPDRFEEDLALAKKNHRHDPYARRPKPQVPHTPDPTPSTDDATPDDGTFRRLIEGP